VRAGAAINEPHHTAARRLCRSAVHVRRVSGRVRAAIRRQCRAAGLRVRTGIANTDARIAWAFHVDHVVTVVAERAASPAIEACPWTAISLSRPADLSGKNGESCSGWCRPLAKRRSDQSPRQGLGQ
jgi:hypothetical protein